jgi:hypothetical protein
LQNTSGGTQTFSVYAKENTIRYVQLLIGSDGGAYVYADLQTGTITAADDTGGNLTYVSSSIAAAVNGFYKVSLSASLGYGFSTYYHIALSDRSTHTAPLSSDSPQFTTSNSLYVWRPKVTEV